MPKRTVGKNGGTGIAKGIGLGYLSALLLLFIYSLIIEKLPEAMNYENVVIILITLLSAAVCGAVAGSGTKGKRGIYALLSGAVFSAIIILLAVLINIDAITVAEIVRIFACGIFGSLLGGIVPLGKSNKKLRKRNR